MTTGCHGLLDVSDPTIVQDKDIANASGANARRLSAAITFYLNATNLAGTVAQITDEWMVDLPDSRYIGPEYYLDRRDSEGYEAYFGAPGSTNDPYLGGWDEVVTKTAVALPEIRAYAQESLRGDFLSQLYAMRGYAILQMAEDICPGFPVNDIVNNQAVYGGPLTTDSAIKYALSQIDSAIAYAHDSTRFVHFAHVLRGRALLDLGQYANAAAAVSEVPADFSFTDEGITYLNRFYNQAFQWDDQQGGEGLRLAVGDRDGGNGLPFVSAHDPRVPTIYRQLRYHTTADSLYDQGKYPTQDVPFVLASGVEAQLIQAEAALNAGDPSWFATLNTLRATAITPAMAAIPVMPTTKSDQVDLLYRERAFWMFMTGRRLGDLRRLVRNYGRDPETVFPTGTYPLLGQHYGRATAIPFILAVQQRVNSRITTGCTTR